MKTEKADPATAQVIALGAPFPGMTDAYQGETPQVVLAENLLCRGGYFDALPQARPVPGMVNAACDLGGFVDGFGDDTIVVGIGRSTSTGHVTCTVTRAGHSVVTDLTAKYGEQPPDPVHYEFGVLAHVIYFCGGQQTFVIDRYTLAAGLFTTVPGTEVNTAPYLTDAMPAKSLTVHDGCMFFVLARDYTFQAEVDLDPNDPFIDNPGAILNGRLVASDRWIFFSDPSKATNIKSNSYFAIEDDGAEVMGCRSWNSSLLIFTRLGLWQLSGSADQNWQLDCVSKDAGCASTASITPIGDAVWWVGTTGIWCISKANGLQKVPGLGWLFGIGGATTAALLELPPSPIAQFGDRVWQAGSASQGVNYASTHYFITGTAGDGTQSVVAVEVDTQRASLLIRSKLNPILGPVVVSDRGSQWLNPRPKILIGRSDGLYYMTAGDSPDATGAALYMRVQMPPVTPVSAARVCIRLSDSGVTAAFGALSLDDAVRLGGNSLPSKNFATTTQGPPGAGTEAAQFDATDSKWLGATPPAGTVFPRWVTSAPIRYNANVYATGTDFLVSVVLTPGMRPYSIERLSLVLSDGQETTA